MPSKDARMLVLKEQDRKILSRWAETYGVSLSAMARIIFREFDQRNRTETVTTGGAEPVEEK